MNKLYADDFPIFSTPENTGLIYFDNAATTQRPIQVIEAIENFSKSQNANPLRGLYSLSSRATQALNSARQTTADFINAEYDEIIFTRNATEAINLVAYSWAMENINAGDEIVLSIMEHHSNILPWQMICQKRGAKLVWLECDKSTGIIGEEEYKKINAKTKILALTHVSNVLGTENPIKKAFEIAHKFGAVTVADGSQAAAHLKIDVKDINADFYAFSAHKMCGPFGIGVLYAKKTLLEQMQPFLRGGEMIEYVTRETAQWSELPHKFEAGTQNVSGAIGLEAAIKYIQNIGIENIHSNDKKLCTLLLEQMQNIPHVNIVGSKDGTKRCGIVSFTIDGVHPHDIATVLDCEKIAIRAGHHCAHPLGEYMQVTSTARASLYFYNSQEEVSKFIQSLSKVRNLMGYGS